MHNPFRYFNSSPEVICLTVMMYFRYPLSLRQVEDLPESFEPLSFEISRNRSRSWASSSMTGVFALIGSAMV